MSKRILYQQSNGVVAVVIPAPNCGLSLQEIGIKDVPTGEPFWIVDVSEIPTDRDNRANWTIDIVEAGSPDGYGG